MGHDVIDRRSLELNRLVADKIRQQPELMNFVRERLHRSLLESRLSEGCKDALREWQAILDSHSLPQVLDLLTEDSDEGQRLRSSAPFAGVLTQAERMDVLRRFPLSGAEARNEGRAIG